MPDLSTSAYKGRIKIDRKAWSQEDIELEYKYTPQKAPSITSWMQGQCRFTAGCLGDSLLTCVPIVRWLPKYERSFLLSDVIAGLTVGIFLVPQ
uniref:SLC26A/SulP transporter domain-containing protein n=1 Tax=Plectus sambesii TaxID=2011161 RepID=A0A914WWM2_9BILA